MTKDNDFVDLMGDLEESLGLPRGGRAAVPDDECDECGDLGYTMVGPNDVPCSTCG